MERPETACNVTQDPPPPQPLQKKEGFGMEIRGDKRGRILIGNPKKKVTSVGKWKWTILKGNVDKYGVKK